ncbi:hypothetical protein [Streptomyces sp. NPDC048669]
MNLKGIEAEFRAAVGIFTLADGPAENMCARPVGAVTRKCHGEQRVPLS